MHRFRSISLLLLAGLTFGTFRDKVRAEDTPKTTQEVLIRVGEQKITTGDLRFLMLSRNVPENLQPKFRKRFLEQLIDRRLIQAFLKEQNAVADTIALKEQITRIHNLLRKHGHDPEQTLKRIGYTEQTLREELALPLAWSAYVNRTVTPQNLRDYFQQHQQEFDGTQVRASQILVRIVDASDPSAVAGSREQLQSIRKQILDEELSFAEAAEKHSDAPSKKSGGDLGFFYYRGKMPELLTRVAFSLKQGELSEPFVTPFGVHLMTVTDRKVGTYALEDVRKGVLKKYSAQLRVKTIQIQRTKIKVEWINPPE